MWLHDPPRDLLHAGEFDCLDGIDLEWISTGALDSIAVVDMIDWEDDAGLTSDDEVET